jgi:hypothetical protein
MLEKKVAMPPLTAVVDDEPIVRQLCWVFLRHQGFRVEEYEDGRDFLARYRPEPGCVVLGMVMPRLSKAGNARLRKALFLPPQTAVRFNPLLRGFFERRVAAGKLTMQAVGACRPCACPPGEP